MTQEGMMEIADRHRLPMNQHTGFAAWVTFWFKCLFGFTVALLVYGFIWAIMGFFASLFLAMLGAAVVGA